MRPGDLRRFKMTKNTYDSFHARMVGKCFVIVRVYGGGWIDILVDGVIDEGWGMSFLLTYTEAIDEAG